MYKVEIQNNFFVVTDTTTGIEEIREVRDQVKWRVSGSVYSFYYNIANLVDQNSPNIIRLGENAKEFDYSEIVDSTETPFVSRAIFNELLNVNLGKIIQITSTSWGLITGDIADQTDLQTILNGKFDDPIGDTTQYIAGDGTLITFPVAGQAGTLVREVRNTTGATLTKGTVVYINGANGNKPTVQKAKADAESTSARTFGLLQSDIANNSNGFCVVIGDLIGVDTSAISEGTQLYLSGTVAGEYTSTKTSAPIHMVYVGKVTRSHPTLGQIEVFVQNGFELDELHDVAISSPVNDQVLQFESATSLWKNKTLATGITVGSTAISSGTDGRVLFQNGGVVQQSANFVWDETNGRLGIGTATPGARLDVRAQGALSTDLALRVRNSANTTNFFSILGNGRLEHYADGSGILLRAYDANTDIGSTGGSVTRVNLLCGPSNYINVNYAGIFGTLFGASRGGLSGETAFQFNATTGSLAGSTNYGKVINILDARQGETRANNVVGLLIKKDSTNTNSLLNFQALSATSGNIGFGVLLNNASAKVQIDSTTQGFLPPRMTNAQRTAIASPAVGLMVYCTDTVEGLYVYKSTGWTFVI